MLRIAVVGVVVDDMIHQRDGSIRNDLGGIAYSVASLAALGGGEVEVIPVCRLAAEMEARVRAAWSALGNVSLHGCVPWSGPASRVELRYGGPGRIGGDREERLYGATPPLSAEEIGAASECDAVLVNCITGAVLQTAAIDRLARVGVPLHLDVHSLLLGRDAEGHRFPSRPDDWREWIDLADTVQCNEQEAATLAGDPDCDERRWRAFLRRLSRDARPRAFVVTRGSAGALAITPDREVGVEAPRVRVVDATGAGDCFGAGFVLARARGAGLVDAVRAGVAAGSAKCEVAGIAALGPKLAPRAGVE